MRKCVEFSKQGSVCFENHRVKGMFPSNDHLLLFKRQRFLHSTEARITFWHKVANTGISLTLGGRNSRTYLTETWGLSGACGERSF